MITVILLTLILLIWVLYSRSAFIVAVKSGFAIIFFLCFIPAALQIDGIISGDTQRAYVEEARVAALSCGEWIEFAPNSTVSSFDNVEARCVNEFVSFYNRTGKGDISIAWFEFKKFKLNGVVSR